jgi:RNA polymerase sigma-70 factor (ECF subfamily)
VFLAAIVAAPTYDPSCGPAKAWLFGIARHRIADSYRAAARESRATAAVVGSELPEPERAVLELVALDELSVAEAAAALQITTVAARVRLHRARRRLAVTEPEQPAAATKQAARLELLIRERQA